MCDAITASCGVITVAKVWTRWDRVDVGTMTEKIKKQQAINGVSTMSM